MDRRLCGLGTTSSCSVVSWSHTLSSVALPEVPPSFDFFTQLKGPFFHQHGNVIAILGLSKIDMI